VPAVVDFQIVGGAIESATVEPGNQGGFCSGAPTFTVSQGGVPGTITPVMSTGAIASGPTTVQVYFPGAHPCQGQSYCLGGHVELENAVLNSLTASALRVGNFSITATYSGDSSYRPATSAALNLTVKRATPSVTVKYPYNSSALGSTITFTATVTGATLPPTGTVAFTDGANPLGSSVLSGGEATFSTNSLGLGAHFIAVSYSGDHDYAGATSAPVQVTVTQKTTPAISLSASSSSVEFGQPVTLTAAVTGSGPLPTGSVSFTSGKTVLGTAELDGTGNARYSTDELPPGGDAIIATYAGDSEYLSATSPTVIVRVFQRSLARPPVSRAVLEPSRE